MDWRVFVILTAEGVLALLLLYISGAIRKPGQAALSAGLIAAAMYLRAMGFEWQTGDYNDFLTKWVAYFADNGGFRGLSGSIGNYNIPYL